MQSLFSRSKYAPVHAQEDGYIDEIGPGSHKKVWKTCHIVLAILLVLNLVVLTGWTSQIFCACPVPTYEPPLTQTSSPLTNVPLQSLSWQPNSSFIDADPHRARYWSNGSGFDIGNPWETLFRSGWIAIPDARKYNLPAGVPLRKFAAKGFEDQWSEGDEGFNPTVLHQVHCVGILKHLIETGKEKVDSKLFEHGEHCIEYLRHSVLCVSDLTLEPPASIGEETFKGTSGWDARHSCRDWNVVHDMLWSRLVRFRMEDGFLRALPDTDAT